MKVRLKAYGVEHTIIDEAKDHYICNNGNGIFAVTKKEVEPVQEWVDVTTECAILTDGFGRYSLFHKGVAVGACNDRYRITSRGPMMYKVEVKK